jgi:hypothetical protein
MSLFLQIIYHTKRIYWYRGGYYGNRTDEYSHHVRIL